MPSATSMLKWLLGAFAAVAALSAQPAVAAPADEALRLVPTDTAICLVIRDLRDHATRVMGSPFATWSQATGYFHQFADPSELAKLNQFVLMLQSRFGITPEQLRDDVLGDAVVFAYQPGPAGRPEDESGLMLVRARKPDVLNSLVSKLNEHQRSSGEIRAIRTRVHRGQTYTEREKAAGHEYYLTLGAVFAFSGQEAMIRAVIDRGLDTAPDDPGPVASGLKQLELTEVLAACWFNPRSFDAALSARAASLTDPNERAFLNQFSKVWSATKGVALYLRPGRGVEVGLVAAVEESRLPAEVRSLLFPPVGSSPLWTVVPDDAFLAVGGRIDVPQWLTAARSFLPDSGKAELTAVVRNGLGPIVGKDRLPALMAGLGPTWAVWATPPTGPGTAWVPCWTVAVKLGTTEKHSADVARPLLSALDFAAQMTRFAYNRDHVDQTELSEEIQDGIVVKFLSNPMGFPRGVRPAYAVKQGYLVAASSPDVVRRFVAPSEGAVSDAPLVRLSARHLRAYLSAHRKPLAALLAGTSSKPVTTVEKELDQFRQMLEPIDKLEIRYSGKGDRVKWSVNLELTQPLCK